MRSKHKSRQGRKQRPWFHHSNREAAQRQEIVCETARIIADEGLLDYQKAKNKAAHRLRYRGLLPNNKEIESAIITHLNIYHASTIKQRQMVLQTLALHFMQLLGKFNPRLCGNVLSGNVSPFSPIQIHINADPPEQISPFLDKHSIPYIVKQKLVNFGAGKHQEIPIYSFWNDETRIEIWALSNILFKCPPICPVHNKPKSRITLAKFKKILNPTMV
jgi:hypothetical protein